MASKKIQALISKLLLKQASSLELDELESWIKNPINEKEFLNYVKANFLIDHNLKQFNPDSTRKRLDELIKKEKRVFRLKRIRKYAAYAAVFLGILFSVYIFRTDIFNTPAKQDLPVIVNTQIPPGTDKATLTLEDGTQVVLEKGTSFNNQTVNSNGEEIVYERKSETKEIKYHFLTIPRGGQHSIVLSDGTRVWLNSESQLKYPSNFVHGKTRKVELIYGEAYFDVSPSTMHNGSKFKVINKSQEIVVMGTEFNIKAYKDETYIYTTLVEGVVNVKYQGVNQILRPAQQSKLNSETNLLKVFEVDVYSEVSWKNGVFIFQGKSLKDIAKTLERWYDVEFVFENQTAMEKKFNGSLKKNVKLSTILNVVKNYNTIQDYEIKDKTIVLK